MFVGDRPEMFYGPLRQCKPLLGAHMYYDRFLQNGAGGLQWVQPLQGTLSATV